MATRNLARTVFEPGHSTEHKNRTRWYTKMHRRRENEYLALVKVNPEIAETNLAPERNRMWWGWRVHDEKVHTAERWLTKQLGRQWDEVWSEVCRRFRGNKRKNRGIREEIERLVQFEGDAAHYRDFIVDTEGILRSESDYEYISNQRKRPYLKPPKSWNENCRIRFLKGEAFWYAGTKQRECFWRDCLGDKHYFMIVTEWKRFRPVNEDELNYLHSLASWKYQDMMLKHEIESYRQRKNSALREGRNPIPLTIID